MKKLLVAFIFGFCGLTTSLVHAQSLEFQLHRTPESPGFFALKIFPNSDIKPIALQNIFVPNFEDAESEFYKELLLLIDEFGGQVISLAQLPKYSKNLNYRIIFLGGELPQESRFLHFDPNKNKPVLESFESFSDEQLNPVFLQNIKATFGGNISDVYPVQISQMGSEPLVFVGKFNRAMKTLMKLNAFTDEGEIIAVSPLLLNDPENFTIDATLADLWESLYYESQPKQKLYNKSWIHFFPLVLAFIGILLILFAMKQIKIHRATKIKSPEDFWHKPTDQIHSENLPFEVTKRENK